MNKPLLQGFQYAAAGFIGMLTIVVPALSEISSQLHEVMRQLLIFNIQNAEFLDSRRIDQVSVISIFKHFRKGGGMDAFIGKRGYLSGGLVGLGNQPVQ